jgi:hypothetical protein
MTQKKPKEKQTQPTRLRMLAEGAAMLVGSVDIGVGILALIGLIPGHQESRTLQPVLWVVSLAMMGGTVWGAWLIVKAILGLK